MRICHEEKIFRYLIPDLSKFIYFILLLLGHFHHSTQIKNSKAQLKILIIQPMCNSTMAWALSGSWSEPERYCWCLWIWKNKTDPGQSSRASRRRAPPVGHVLLRTPCCCTSWADFFWFDKICNDFTIWNFPKKTISQCN